MCRDSYRQGVDDAQRFGEPNQRFYSIDPDYADGFDGYMRENPMEEKIRTDVERDILQ